MPRHLDPRFQRIIEFMDGASSNIERAAARENAEDVAKACGFTYAEALAELRRPGACGQPWPAEPEPEIAGDPRPDPSHPSSTIRDRAIAEALAADASCSDRSIARACQCSPTTVGRIRSAAGLARQVRVVSRRGKSYEMRVANARLGDSPAATGRRPLPP